jgi:hypothetical protein
MLAGLQTTTDKAPPFDFHVGLVESFSQVTGENTVTIRGSLIHNVPMLNIGDTVNLVEGDNVVVLKWQTGYFILGRIVQPNSDMFATAAVAFKGEVESANNFAITTTMTVHVSETFDIPPWANRVLAFGTVDATGINSLGALDQLRVRCDVDGFNGAVHQCDVNPTFLGSVSATHVIDNVATPGGTFAIDGLAQTNDGTWASSAFNQLNLSASAIFTKV